MKRGMNDEKTENSTKAIPGYNLRVLRYPLKLKKVTKSKAAEYLSWAEKIGKNRIDNIVSNKHRNAYERAAQVLGSLAETYAAMGQKNKAVKILHKYYNEKYNRFSAFRREVKAVVKKSDILRNAGFLD